MEFQTSSQSTTSASRTIPVENRPTIPPITCTSSFRSRTVLDDRIFCQTTPNSGRWRESEVVTIPEETLVDRGRSHTCARFIGNLTVLNVEGIPVLFAEKFRIKFTEDLDFRHKLSLATRIVTNAVSNIRSYIAKALNISKEQLSVSLTAVDPTILGFTAGGPVMVNVVPFIGTVQLNDEAQMAIEDSVFLTICHELCHRASQHDTFFAQENAKLVYLLTEPQSNLKSK